MNDPKYYISAITCLVGVLGFAKVVFEYNKSLLIKRAEFLEKLITEFNSPATFLARRILDDFWIGMESTEELTDAQLLEQRSKSVIEKETLSADVKELFRHHSQKPVILNSEQRARQSFDDFFDFFAKIDYFLSLKLITPKEVLYFKYYLERCVYKADGAALGYARAYGYSSFIRLLAEMNIGAGDNENIKD